MKFSWWNRANPNKIKFTPTSSEEFRRTYVERILEANITNFNHEKEKKSGKKLPTEAITAAFAATSVLRGERKTKNVLLLLLLFYIYDY